MSILETVVFFLGFYLLYNTSKKVVLQQYLFVRYMQKRPLLFKILAVLLIVFGFYKFTNRFGIGVGIFMGLVVLMTVCSLLVLLLPLPHVKHKRKK